MSTNIQHVARALPDYELGREVGRGGFGIVWGGRHRQLGREVAVKQLAGPLTSTAEYQTRFRREARILAQVDHPHVVTVYDYRERDDLRLLVMELLPGGTFADRRATGMTGETAIASALAAASGLHHVHEQGILHRDVKPENLMFDRRATLKVTDFGIARSDLVDATAVNVTHAGEFFGTPAYVSPEQAGYAFGQPVGPVGAAADQYSLAAVLYEALSGQLTHDAPGGAVALCTRRMTEDPRPLRDMEPGIPYEIDVVIMKALARDPLGRYATIEEFAVALGTASSNTLGADWLERSEVQLRDFGPILDAALGPRSTPPPPPAPPAPPAVPPSAAPPAAAASDADAPRRRTGLMIGALVAAVVVGLGVALLVARLGDKGGGTTPEPKVADVQLHLTKQWSAPTGGNVISSPAVAGELIAVGSDDHSVYGLDSTTGATKWKFGTEDSVRSSPVIVDNRVYVGSSDGRIYALDSSNGAVVWKKDIGHTILSAPAVGGGVVVVGSDHLYAFDATNGADRWSFTPGAPLIAAPVIAGGTVIVGSEDHYVYGVNLVDGQESWRWKTGKPVRSTAAIADGVAYVGSNDGFLYALDLTSEKELWATDLGGPVRSSPLVAGGRVYVGTGAGRLVAIDRANGKVRWSFASPNRIDSSPVLDGNVIVVGSSDGNVYAVDADTGESKGEFATKGSVLSSPALVGSDIVVGSVDNAVYRIKGFDSPSG